MRGRAVGLFVVVLVVALVAFLFLRASAVPAGMTRPSDGFTLHIDAEMHFPGQPKTIAHHWCKGVAGLIECQLYDSDRADARLVGVETVVPTAVWKTFDATERARWHYHRLEIPMVHATLPDLSPAEAAKVVASLQETYGKIYLLWDPSRQKLPTGLPTLTILKH